MTSPGRSGEGHTPGPWLMAAKASSIVGWPIVAPRAEGRVVCSLNYADPAAFGGRMTGDGAFNKESRANGLLIAAAPEMLTALATMRDLLRKLQPALNVMAREVMDDIIADQIDPAIAKATGKATP